MNTSDPCVGTVKHSLLSVMCQVPPVPPTSNSFKYVYDMGQEFAGVARLTLPKNTAKGGRFTLKYAEALTHPPLCDDPHSSYSACDGSVYMGNLFWANPVPPPEHTYFDPNAGLTERFAHIL